MNYQIVLEEFISRLSELSSLSLQRKLWLNENNDTNLISSYDELVNSLNDGGYEDFVAKKIINLSCRKKLVKLLAMVNQYEEPCDYSNTGLDIYIIQDSKWKSITKFARSVLESDCISNLNASLSR